MGNAGRKPRPMYVRQTTVYLSEKDDDAIDDIRKMARTVRGDKVPAMNDAISYSLSETRKILKSEMDKK